MYFLKEYDIERCILIRKGPSRRKFIKSLIKALDITFELDDGKELVGRIKGIESEGNGYYFGGTFKDSTMVYEVEGYYDPKTTKNSFMQFGHAVRQDAPIRVHISATH